MTHRQSLAWQYWLAHDINIPSRADHYAMQIAALLYASNTDEKNVNTNRFRLEFKVDNEPSTTEAVLVKQEQQFEELASLGYSVPKRMTKEDIAKAQQNMMAWTGAKPKRPTPPDPRTRANARTK